MLSRFRRGNGTDRKLRDGVVDDVERVAVRKVEDDLEEERGAVDHRGLDDEHEHLDVVEGCTEGVSGVIARDEPAIFGAVGRFQSSLLLLARDLSTERNN